MSESMHILDPEVEGLLRELSGGPDSTLLRVAREREPHEPFPGRSERARREARGRTAEAKLLDCYREEVAYLLRCHYYEGYLAQDCLAALEPLILAREAQSSTRRAPVMGRALKTKLRHEVEALSSAFGGSDRADLVIEAGLAALGAARDRLAIATAAFRLVPSDAARMYLGYEYLTQGWTDAAVECFLRVADGASDSGVRASGRVAAGVAEMARGQYGAALAMFERAASTETGLASVELNGLSAALQLGDVTSIRSLLPRVEERRAATAGLVEAWASSLTASRAAGQWSPTAEAKLAIRELGLPSSSTTGVLLEVFAD